MTLPRLIGLACLGMLLAAPTWAQELLRKTDTCPHAEGWEPKDELQRILSDHQPWLRKFEEVAKRTSIPSKLKQWIARNPEGRAILCNANLSMIDLKGAFLSGANLNNADLSFAKLSDAHLDRAELNNADLSLADLSHAQLDRAELNNATLFGADLNYTNLNLAELHNANLFFAKLDHATLLRAELNNANLYRAILTNAELDETAVAGAKLAFADLSGARYAPASQPPDYVAGIKGLQTVNFAPDRADGLAQLRDLLQKNGLRDLEREATFAIESGKTKDAFAERRTAEGVFRLVAFDLTTAYGLHPARALLVIVALWGSLVPIYAWSIWRRPRRSTSPSGIYRTWPKDRLEVREGNPTLDNPARVERLHRRGPTIFGWAAYFSLLSAFQIGFREFSVGTWLARAQPRNFVLEPTGWVRTVSGLQSLLSVYLLAIWALTYFGRPFQ